MFKRFFCIAVVLRPSHRLRRTVERSSIGRSRFGSSPTDTPVITSPEEASRLMIDRTQIFDIDVHDEYEKERGNIAGLQFYQGEPVMLEVKAYDYRSK